MVMIRSLERPGQFQMNFDVWLNYCIMMLSVKAVLIASFIFARLGRGCFTDQRIVASAVRDFASVRRMDGARVSFLVKVSVCSQSGLEGRLRDRLLGVLLSVAGLRVLARQGMAAVGIAVLLPHQPGAAPLAIGVDGTGAAFGQVPVGVLRPQLAQDRRPSPDLGEPLLVSADQVARRYAQLDARIHGAIRADQTR
jgi:hypothetical protein